MMSPHGDPGAIRWHEPRTREEAIKDPRWARVLWTDGKQHVWTCGRLGGYTALCGYYTYDPLQPLTGTFDVHCKRCEAIISKSGTEGEE